MQFISGYNSLNDMYGAMDRPAYEGGEAVANPDVAGNPAVESAGDLGLGVKDIGMSVPMGISAPNVQGVYSKHNIKMLIFKGDIFPNSAYPIHLF